MYERQFILTGHSKGIDPTFKDNCINQNTATRRSYPGAAANHSLNPGHSLNNN